MLDTVVGDCGTEHKPRNLGDTSVQSWKGAPSEIPLRYGFAKGSGNYGYNHINRSNGQGGDEYHRETLENNYISTGIIRGKPSLDGKGITGDKTKVKYELYEARCGEDDRREYRSLTVIVDFASVEGIGQGDMLGVKTAYFSKWKKGDVPLDKPYIQYRMQW